MSRYSPSRTSSVAVKSDVIAVRFGDEIVRSHSIFTCGAPSPKRPCLPQVYRRWAQSIIPGATGFAVRIQVNVFRDWPPPRSWQKYFVTLSAFKLPFRRSVALELCPLDNLSAYCCCCSTDDDCADSHQRGHDVHALNRRTPQPSCTVLAMRKLQVRTSTLPRAHQSR